MGYISSVSARSSRPCSKDNMSLLRPALRSDICDELLDKKRFECDPLADDAVLVAVRDRGENILRNHELYSTVKEMERTDLSCARFMVFYEQEPPWNVEWKRYEWGRRLFVRNSGIAGLVLMYCSLVLSFTASLGNKVISLILVMRLSMSSPSGGRGWGGGGKVGQLTGI